MLEMLDTFPAFLEYWDHACSMDLDDQIDAWSSVYMSQWPELLSKQIDDYASQQEDWRDIARERIFPYLGARLPSMHIAHSTLLDVCSPIFRRVSSELDYSSDVQFVIYVGLGCGAGWATTFRNRPAILFGLESIAECGWSSVSAMEGLVVHELGHLVLNEWRIRSGKALGTGPLWELYQEGFAQRIEQRITGTWHQTSGAGHDDWLDWCMHNEMLIARRFLKSVRSDNQVRDFFGSWFQIEGRSQTGYYLGHEIIRRLEKSNSLEEIAGLDDIELRILQTTEEIAGLGA